MIHVPVTLGVRPHVGLHEPPGAPRIVAGGPLAGQIVSATGYSIVIADPVPAATTRAPRIVEHNALRRYDGVEVTLAGVTWPMWSAVGQDLGEFAIDAVLSLIRTDPRDMERNGLTPFDKTL